VKNIDADVEAKTVIVEADESVVGSFKKYLLFHTIRIFISSHFLAIPLALLV
jgi:hypothetical protein